MKKTFVSWSIRLGVVLLLAGVAFGAWRYWRNSTAPTLEERYQLVEITKGNVVQTVTASGTLNPVVLVNVGTQVSGTVRKLHADFNSTVTAGQVLLELDPTLFRAAVTQSRGNVANATAALKLARANEARIRGLFVQEYVSRQDLDNSVQALEAAQAQLTTARGQLARDEANVNYSVIRSPVAGIVVSRQVDVGQTVAASFQTPTLFQIARDLTNMQINTNVAEADVGKIRIDQPVRFTVDAFPGRRFDGKVTQIRLSPIIQQNVVTYNVVVGVDNRELKLMPGMTAYISVDVDQRDDVLLLPNAALRFRPRDIPPEAKAANDGAGGKKPRVGARVYVVRGSALVPVTVQAGLTDNKFVEVLGSELKAGERVAIQNRVSEGANGAPPAGQAPRVRAF